MSDRWEFCVKDALGDDGEVAFAAINGVIRVSSPKTWTVDAGTYREIEVAWSEACGAADWQGRQRGVSPS